MKTIVSTILFFSLSYANASAITWFSGGNKKNELDLNQSLIQIHTYKYGSESRTDINMYASYGYLLQPQLQLLIEAGIQSNPMEDGTLFALMGGATYNFDSRLDDAFFVQGAVGLHPAYKKTKGKFESEFSFFAGGGKRFAITNSLSLKPFARIIKNGSEDTSLLIQPFNFSFTF